MPLTKEVDTIEESARRTEVNDDEHSPFHSVRNWLLLRMMCGTKRLNLFFSLHEASKVLNEYVIGVKDI